MNKTALLQKIGNDKKTAVIICIGVLGMILLLLSCFLPSGLSKKTEDGGSEFSALEEKTEKKLVQLLSSVKNAGRVKVIVTYECAEGYEYAEDEKKQGD